MSFSSSIIHINQRKRQNKLKQRNSRLILNHICKGDCNRLIICEEITYIMSLLSNMRNPHISKNLYTGSLPDRYFFFLCMRLGAFYNMRICVWVEVTQYKSLTGKNRMRLRKVAEGQNLTVPQTSSSFTRFFGSIQEGTFGVNYRGFRLILISLYQQLAPFLFIFSYI